MKTKEKTPNRSSARAKTPHGRGASLQGRMTRPAEAAGMVEAPTRERLGDRERVALATLLAEARGRALAIAMKVLRNPDDAEDAVQEAYVKVCRKFERFEGRAAFTTWLHRIVFNASLDLLRRQARRAEVGAPTEAEDDGPPVRGEWIAEGTPESEVARRETGEVVRRTLAALGEPHREVLRRREFEDCSYEEIASAARCPVGTVMSRLHHARRRFSDALARTISPEEIELLSAA